MRTKIHITVDHSTIHLLNRLQKAHSLSLGQAVDFLARKELNYNKKDAFAEAVASKVVEKMKKS